MTDNTNHNGYDQLREPTLSEHVIELTPFLKSTYLEPEFHQLKGRMVPFHSYTHNGSNSSKKLTSLELTTNDLIHFLPSIRGKKVFYDRVASAAQKNDTYDFAFWMHFHPVKATIAILKPETNPTWDWFHFSNSYTPITGAAKSLEWLLSLTSGAIGGLAVGLGYGFKLISTLLSMPYRRLHTGAGQFLADNLLGDYLNNKEKLPHGKQEKLPNVSEDIWHFNFLRIKPSDSSTTIALKSVGVLAVYPLVGLLHLVAQPFNLIGNAFSYVHFIVDSLITLAINIPKLLYFTFLKSRLITEDLIEAQTLDHKIEIAKARSIESVKTFVKNTLALIPLAVVTFLLLFPPTSPIGAILSMKLSSGILFGAFFAGASASVAQFFSGAIQRFTNKFFAEHEPPESHAYVPDNQEKQHHKKKSTMSSGDINHHLSNGHERTSQHTNGTHNTSRRFDSFVGHRETEDDFNKPLDIRAALDRALDGNGNVLPLSPPNSPPFVAIPPPAFANLADPDRLSQLTASTTPKTFVSVPPDTSVAKQSLIDRTFEPTVDIEKSPYLSFSNSK